MSQRRVLCTVTHMESAHFVIFKKGFEIFTFEHGFLLILA